MIYISIDNDDQFITLNCHKGSKDGEFFQLVIDANTMKVVKRPPNPDIDATTAYSHVYILLSLYILEDILNLYVLHLLIF